MGGGGGLGGGGGGATLTAWATVTQATAARGGRPGVEVGGGSWLAGADVPGPCACVVPPGVLSWRSTCLVSVSMSTTPDAPASATCRRGGRGW